MVLLRSLLQGDCPQCVVYNLFRGFDALDLDPEPARPCATGQSGHDVLDARLRRADLDEADRAGVGHGLGGFLGRRFTELDRLRLRETDELVPHSPRRLHATVPDSVDGRLPGPDGGPNGLLRHAGGDEVLNGG